MLYNPTNNCLAFDADVYNVVTSYCFLTIANIVKRTFSVVEIILITTYFNTPAKNLLHISSGISPALCPLGIKTNFKKHSRGLRVYILKTLTDITMKDTMSNDTFVKELQKAENALWRYAI